MFKLVSLSFFLLSTFSLQAQVETDELALLKEPGLAFEYDKEFEQKNCSIQCTPPLRFENDAQYGRDCGLRGIWFPEAPVLFAPLVADPREMFYSVAWRSYERSINQDNVVAVSFADLFPIYRFFNVGPLKGGELEIDLQGAMWAIFAPFDKCCPLLNTDYYVGVPITYASGLWSFRLRGYHISCHLGDEFMILNPDVYRRNPSSEFLDFFASYDYRRSFRFYAGLGGALTEDKSFKSSRVFGQFGLEYRPDRFKVYSCKNRLYAVPLFAANFSVQDKTNHYINTSCILGYEIGKLSGWQHKIRAYFEYYNGYCFEGQFATCPTEYFAFKLSYGY
jgi:hypothetical protein